MKRLLVVSHPCVVEENQTVYARLQELGWSVTIVVPARWRHAYSQSSFAPRALPGIELMPLRVALRGRPQRHFYLASASRVIRELEPDAVFVEQEPFALATLQWARAAQRAGIPFGVQAAENLKRPFPLLARAIRRWSLARAAFVAARSARAGELAREQGAVGDVELVAHAVPDWTPVERTPDDLFTVGFAGRLVPEKGVPDLVEAMRLLGRPARLLLAGDGPLADELASRAIPGVEIELARGLGHAGMTDAYGRMDVLVLPSRTTEKWAEQFGRVLVEALACGVPVVGSSSGEIPWVIAVTGGGRTFPERDPGALADVLRELMDDEPQRRRLASAGQAAVSSTFTAAASARALDALLTRDGRRPTVALVAHGIHDAGGMERAFYELVRRGAGRFDFVVVSAELSEELRPLVRWTRVRVPMRPISLKTPLFFLHAGRIVRRTRADIVHTLGAIVPNRADIATVQFCHAGHRERTGRLGPRAAPPLRRLNTTLSRGFALAAERWCYRRGRVGTLAAVSGGVAEELRRHYPGVPVVLTPNGVDLERFRPDAAARDELRRQRGVAADDVVAILVGGDWDHKGLAVAIEGLATAQRTSARRLRLWVVGRGDERRFGAVAAQLGVGDAVTFIGVQSDVERYLQAADVFVLPSLYETFSLAAHEAAATGLPVVSTRVSGIAELLEDGDAGLVVERDGASVAAALAQLADDEHLRESMGAAARQRACLRTWDASVESVIALYEGKAPSETELSSAHPVFEEVQAP